MQGFRGIRYSTAAIDDQERVEGIAVHIRSMQKANEVARNNKFV
jgi:hypothetical protein